MMYGDNELQTRMFSEVEIVTLNTGPTPGLGDTTVSNDSDGSDNSDFISTSFIVESRDILALHHPELNSVTKSDINDPLLKDKVEIKEDCGKSCVSKTDEPFIDIEESALKTEINAEKLSKIEFGVSNQPTGTHVLSVTDGLKTKIEIVCDDQHSSDKKAERRSKQEVKRKYEEHHNNSIGNQCSTTSCESEPMLERKKYLDKNTRQEDTISRLEPNLKLKDTFKGKLLRKHTYSESLYRHRLNQNNTSHTGCKRHTRDTSNAVNLVTNMKARSNVKTYSNTNCKLLYHSGNQPRRETELHSTKSSYQCKNCDRVFFHKRLLTIHSRNHTKTFHCSECSSSFAQKSTLLTHIRHIHIHDKSYICEFCQRRFVTKLSWTRHVRLHTGIRPFKCDLCGSDFVAKDRLISHLQNHSDPKPFKCTRCKETFKWNPQLRWHLLTQHR